MKLKDTIHIQGFQITIGSSETYEDSDISPYSLENSSLISTSQNELRRQHKVEDFKKSKDSPIPSRSTKNLKENWSNDLEVHNINYINKMFEPGSEILSKTGRVEVSLDDYIDSWNEKVLERRGPRSPGSIPKEMQIDIRTDEAILTKDPPYHPKTLLNDFDIKDHVGPKMRQEPLGAKREERRGRQLVDDKFIDRKEQLGNDYQFGIEKLNNIHEKLIEDFQRETLEEFDTITRELDEARQRSLKRFQKLNKYIHESSLSVRDLFNDD